MLAEERATVDVIDQMGYLESTTRHLPQVAEAIQHYKIANPVIIQRQFNEMVRYIRIAIVNNGPYSLHQASAINTRLLPATSTVDMAMLSAQVTYLNAELKAEKTLKCRV